MIEEVKKILDELLHRTIASMHGFKYEGTINDYAQQICQLFEPKPDEGRLLTDMEKPWDKEDWQKAKGIKVRKGETNSAFAERDYSIQCEPQHLISKVKGYWIWWCSIHHQPLAWCEVDKAKAQRDLTASIIRAECQARIEGILEWGIEPCYEHQRGGGVFTRRECPRCWQSLKKKEGVK